MMKAKKSRAVISAAVVAAALLCVLAASAAFAAPQVGPGAPVAPKSSVSDKPPVTVKPLKFKGIVVTASAAAIMVRNPTNPRQPMSFSYSPAVRDQMIKILTAGGFHYGDKVTVVYAPGTTVALKLQGKPSKAKKQPPPPQTSQ
jgi:hypothetical protein